MMMLGTTVSGDAYTWREYDVMYREAGFAWTAVHPIPNAPHMVVRGCPWYRARRELPREQRAFG